MSETVHLRQRLVDIARRDLNKVEESKNHAPWIEKLWPATSYPEGYKAHEPYCAAGVAYCVKTWLQDIAIQRALGMTFDQALNWRCQSAAAFGWLDWAKEKRVEILPRKCILHTADLVVYNHSHIEIVTNDDNTIDGPFVAIGYNTNASGARDGEGCFEKPRKRDGVKAFIRLLP